MIVHPNKTNTDVGVNESMVAKKKWAQDRGAVFAMDFRCSRYFHYPHEAIADPADEDHLPELEKALQRVA